MKKSLNMKKGFTLIELLVVVAIIGTLTAVVLIGVNNGRRAGRDAAIQTGLNQALTQLQVNATQNNGLYFLSATQTNVAASLTSAGIDTATQKIFTDNGSQLWYDTNPAVGGATRATSMAIFAAKSGSNTEGLCLQASTTTDVTAIRTVTGANLTATRALCVAL